MYTQMDGNTLNMYQIQLLGVQFSSIFAIDLQLYMFLLWKYCIQQLTLQSIFMAQWIFLKITVNYHILTITSNICNMSSTFMKWITMLDTLCQKSMLICVISDTVREHPNISNQLHVWPYIWSILAYWFGRVHMLFFQIITDMMRCVCCIAWKTRELIVQTW